MFTLEQKVDLILRYIATTDKNRQNELKKLVLEALNSGEEPATATAPAPVTPDIDEIIADMLKDAGMPQHVNGYYYVVTGLKLCVANPGCLQAITKELYPAIAKIHGTTPSRVERSIRHAVELVFDRNDMHTLMSIFGNTVSMGRGKLSNSEFLSFYTNEINRKLKRLNGAQ